jgi:hypothetical protein
MVFGADIESHQYVMPAAAGIQKVTSECLNTTYVRSRSQFFFGQDLF